MRISLRLFSTARPVSAKMLNELVDYYAQFIPSSISLETFMEFGRKSKLTSEKTSFLFLRKELPVRLANIMKEIHLLPEQLLATQSVHIVEGWYEQSFQEILQYEKVNTEDPDIFKNFNESLIQIHNRHSTVVETMAQGIIELKENSIPGHSSSGINNLENQIQYFLDRFYMSRISIRMLINQHTLLFGSEQESLSPRNIGSIDPSCRVIDVAHDAYENARFLCEQYYMTAPECEFVTLDAYGDTKENDALTVCYVPSHLYHMLFELFKNSLRAVVEKHGEDSLLPPLKVLICKGQQDLTVKISDQGGGIIRSNLPLLFNYMYSTAPRPPSPAAASSTPLAGYGYGLPLSRLYAKYFLGDLNLATVEGFGTDAYINIKVLPNDASELLPVFNKTSSAKYFGSQVVSDWSDATHSDGLHTALNQKPSRSYSTSVKK